jgi:hypothetical protein
MPVRRVEVNVLEQDTASISCHEHGGSTFSRSFGKFLYVYVATLLRGDFSQNVFIPSTAAFACTYKVACRVLTLCISLFSKLADFMKFIKIM